VKLLSYNGKRLVLGICLVLIGFTAANYCFEWGLFGRADRPLPMVMVFLCVVLMHIFGPSLEVEMQRRIDADEAAAAAAELERDKSHDAEDAAAMRRDIGMPPDEREVS
jgi:hypothetical protein